uniref:COMM domain-containing protein 4-like n=1 Tax=Sinocyclocheilus grahami TaxID=75366 RepID=A0A672MIE7_SINGR
MRFRFCGDLDCPDWVLAEMSTLARIVSLTLIGVLFCVCTKLTISDSLDCCSSQSSVKMKLLCVQVIKDLLDEGIDYDKVSKLTSDAKFESGDAKASIAVLSFILSSAAKHDVDSESLSSELQQLGLPKEHTTGLCKSYEDKHIALQEKLRESSLRLGGLEAVNWRVDYTLSSSELKQVNEPTVQLRLQAQDPETDSTQTTTVSITADKFRVLLTELKQAQTMMNALQ